MEPIKLEHQQLVKVARSSCLKFSKEIMRDKGINENDTFTVLMYVENKGDDKKS